MWVATAAFLALEDGKARTLPGRLPVRSVSAGDRTQMSGARQLRRIQITASSPSPTSAIDDGSGISPPAS